MSAILLFFIWLALVALVIYVVIWAIQQIVQPPARVIQILYVIGVLILLYYVVAFFPLNLPFPPGR